ncbi:unnamed protein product [Clonostachys rhizophaga]|uniref:Nucleoside phosphorylase domain-containing protein n=1 Tax=Clonostachys rhizophaga TaxID=160324 RepID=A0A9N9VK23_9HYPO|nr:unnamed protein product [Clonostachys rhizophaga]
MRTFSVNDYTVGWICTLVKEYVAARVFLDETYEGPDRVSPNDCNAYTLGRIHNHNIVIAVLPEGEYGISSATGVIKDMLHSFPNIKIALMVGIGGGAPRPMYDIRLGDIVVGAGDIKGGVIQYDFGKTIQSQEFQSTGFFNQPPSVLLRAVNNLISHYHLKGHQLHEAVNSILKKKPRLQKNYKRPDLSSDRLYRSDIVHPPTDTASCSAVCGDDPSNLILRQTRGEDEDNPAIHYGLIASANQLMKDASVRDKLAAERGVLCFEMEAAGLMNQFPCMVIRGICDYADSHKNKEWQGHAAMAAAAYAKDLLSYIPPAKVEAERKIGDVLHGLEDVIGHHIAQKRQDDVPRLTITDDHLAVASTDLFGGEEPESSTLSRVRFKAPIHDDIDSAQEDDERSEKDSDSSSDRGSDFSVDRASTAPTEAEIDVTNIDDIVRTFLDLIFENENSLAAIRLSLGRRSEYLVEKQIRLLLKQFVAGLRTEFETSDKNIVSLFSGRSIAISRKIIEEVGSSLEMTPETSNMATHDATSATKDEDEEAGLKAEGGDDDTDGEGGDDDTDGEEDNILTAEIDVLGFQRFISSSAAFQLFLDDIYHLAFPSFKKSLKSLLRRWRRKGLGIQVEKIISEILYSQPKVITVTEEQPTWSDRIKELVETSTGEPWSWWPLRPKFAPLQQGQVRIAWLCKCGETRSEVVPREVGKSLKKMSLGVAASGPKPVNISGPSAPDQVHLRPLSRSSTYMPANVPALPHQDSYRRTTGPHLRNRRAYATQTQEVDLNSLAVYFMVDNSSLFPWKAGLQRSLITSTNLCDEVFYWKMRQEYWKHRGWWRQWFSLYTFVGCDFYQFKRYRANRFRESQPGLPNQTEDKYEYDDEDPPPQVSWEEFKDGYWYNNTNCFSASQCSGMEALRRIPQKIIETAQDGKHDVFWGIVARQQKSFAMVLIYITIAGLPIFLSIWFFFWWLNPGELTDEIRLANRRDNLSNAFIPLGIAIAFEMGVLACVR